MKKTKIFISHIAPADNYFAIWLSAKLKLIGYDVWVEVDELKSGDAFWPVIDNIIRNESVKFICVISAAYVKAVKDPNSGVFKEISCADRIKNINNFKTPLCIENVNYDDFPLQLMGLNSLDFYQNWQRGLEKLLESFSRENISFDPAKRENPLNFWLDSFHIDQKTTFQPERIYTNWFPFELPSKLYVHKYSVNGTLELVDIPYAFIDYSDRHICFFPASDYPYPDRCLSSKEFCIEQIINEKALLIDDSLTLIEPRKKIIELLNKTMQHFFIQQNVKRYQQSAKEVYYYPNTHMNRKRINLHSIGKTNVSVTGRTGNNFWSFGISSSVNLYPFPYLKIASHIIFENQNFNLIDQDEQHTLRRKYGFNWYNKDWLDTLIGMMIKLSGEAADAKIHIPISSQGLLAVDVLPFNMESDFGYNEPLKDEANAEAE